eukprot:3178058-Pyramimonas_sp.AAC.1
MQERRIVSSAEVQTGGTEHPRCAQQMRRYSCELDEKIWEAVKSSDLLETFIADLGLSLKSNMRADPWPMQATMADLI